MIDHLKRSLGANLRADRQKLHSKAELQGESAKHSEALPDLWGMVNAVVVSQNEVINALGVQGRIMLFPEVICSALRPPIGESA